METSKVNVPHFSQTAIYHDPHSPHPTDKSYLLSRRSGRRRPQSTTPIQGHSHKPQRQRHRTHGPNHRTNLLDQRNRNHNRRQPPNTQSHQLQPNIHLKQLHNTAKLRNRRKHTNRSPTTLHPRQQKRRRRHPPRIPRQQNLHTQPNPSHQLPRNTAADKPTQLRRKRNQRQLRYGNNQPDRQLAILVGPTNRNPRRIQLHHTHKPHNTKRRLTRPYPKP